MKGSATAVRRSMVTVCAAALARTAHGTRNARAERAAEKERRRFAVPTVIAQCPSLEGVRDFESKIINAVLSEVAGGEPKHEPARAVLKPPGSVFPNSPAWRASSLVGLFASRSGR